MKSRFNSVFLGLGLGILAPVIAILIFFLFNGKGQSLIDFFFQILKMQILTQLVSLCVIPNLLLFFIFIWTDKLYSARGVLFATFIWAFIVFGIKFLI